MMSTLGGGLQGCVTGTVKWGEGSKNVGTFCDFIYGWSQYSERLEWINAYDADADGTLNSLDELREASQASNSYRTTLRLAFDLVDENGDGYVSEEELEKTLVIQDGVELMDLNGDSLVDVGEFEVQLNYGSFVEPHLD